MTVTLIITPWTIRTDGNRTSSEPGKPYAANIEWPAGHALHLGDDFKHVDLPGLICRVTRRQVTADSKTAIYTLHVDARQEVRA